MTILDSPIRNVTQTLLNIFGAAATHGTITTGEYFPGVGATKTTASASVKVVLDNYVKREGGQVAGTGLRAYIAAQGLSVAPNAKDTLTVGGRAHEILSVQEIRSGDLAALYQLELAS